MTSPSSAPAPTGHRNLLAILIAMLFIALIALLLYGVRDSGRHNRTALPSPLIDKPAPRFSLPLLHEPERTVTLDTLRGQPFVLNVWGSWCPACRDEHPVLSRFAAGKRVRVIGYNWNDERADALRWLEQYGNPYWMVLVDYGSRDHIDWGIYGAPETFLVDGNGVVRWKYVGPLTQQVIDRQLLPALDQIEAQR